MMLYEIFSLLFMVLEFILTYIGIPFIIIFVVSILYNMLREHDKGVADSNKVIEENNNMSYNNFKNKYNPKLTEEYKKKD